MDNIYYFANVGTDGAAWSGYFEVSSIYDTVQSTLPSNIVVNSPSAFSFVPAAFNGYSGKYVTWRTYTGALQYPTLGDGYSFDVWSDEFHDNITINNMNWIQLVAYIAQLGQGRYLLRPDKYTHIYDYGPANLVKPASVFQGRAGYLELSTIPIP